MFHIAICDDEYSTCNELENITLNLQSKFQISLNTDIFYSGEALCEHLLHGNKYDIIFLDIELETTSGIEVGDFIRNKQNDNDTLIIFISSKEHYALQLFKIGTFEFLIKPFTTANVEELLFRAFKYIERGKQSFVFSTNKTTHRLMLKDILYFQSKLRKIQITTFDGCIEFYGQLDSILHSLPANTFVQIHKSYIVNTSYIKTYSYENVEMVNDDFLSISNPFRKKVRAHFLDLRGKH